MAPRHDTKAARIASRVAVVRCLGVFARRRLEGMSTALGIRWLDSSVERTPRHEQRARPPGDCDRRRGATRLAELNWKKLDVFGC